jgi:hypothetical protein
MNRRDTCPICAGALDPDGLCPACVEGAWENRPALSLDGTLSRPDPRAPPPSPAPAERFPAPPPTGPVAPPPDPTYGVPLELDLGPRSFREERPLELDESALAAARRSGAREVVPSAPVERRETPPRRRWPWVLAGAVVLALALITGAGAAGYRLADGLLRELVARLPETLSFGEAKPHGPHVLEPGLAGAVLVIDSTPSGADVYLGDERLGTTPLAVDNPYAEGERFQVTVKKPGYRPARLDAAGGGPARLEVTLERASR